MKKPVAYSIKRLVNPETLVRWTDHVNMTYQYWKHYKKNNQLTNLPHIFLPGWDANLSAAHPPDVRRPLADTQGAPALYATLHRLPHGQQGTHALRHNMLHCN